MAVEESAQTLAELLERAVALADTLGLDLVAAHAAFAGETLRAVQAASTVLP